MIVISHCLTLLFVIYWLIAINNMLSFLGRLLRVDLMTLVGLKCPSVCRKFDQFQGLFPPPFIMGAGE